MVVSVAEVCQASHQKVLYNLAVAVSAGRLKNRAFVPVKAEPLQFGQQGVGELGSVAFHIGVFNPQYERTSRRACM